MTEQKKAKLKKIFSQAIEIQVYYSLDDNGNYRLDEEIIKDELDNHIKELNKIMDKVYKSK